MRADYFARKRMQTLLYFALLLAVAAGAMIITEYDVAKTFTSLPKAVQWAFGNFYPDKQSLSRFPDIIGTLLETLLVSVAATTVGAVFALLFAILGSHTTSVGRVASTVSRAIATAFRNIDVSAWSMILLFSFGQNVLTGYFALFFGSFGFLTRAFMETIDEVSGGSVEALKATGAGYFSIIFQSVIPSAIPQLLSWMLFMVETNIRHATLVGILTGSGIGFIFNLYYKNLDYHAASLVVVVIVAVILLIESISNYVRRVMM